MNNFGVGIEILTTFDAAQKRNAVVREIEVDFPERFARLLGELEELLRPEHRPRNRADHDELGSAHVEEAAVEAANHRDVCGAACVVAMKTRA